MANRIGFNTAGRNEENIHIISWSEITPEAQRMLGKTCQPGVEYLGENEVLGSFMANCSSHVTVRPWEHETSLDPKGKYDGKRIMVMRSGGLGDLLFATAAIRAFKKRHPKSEVFFSTLGQGPLMLINNPDLTGFLPYPCPLEKLPDYVVAMEHMAEYNQDGGNVHIVDLFAKRMGLKLGPDEKRQVLVMNEDEVNGAAEYLPPLKDGKYRFGIQVVSNIPARSYPYMVRVAESLIKRGHQVIAFGVPGQPSIPRAINTHTQNPPLNIRQSASLVTQCDCIIAPDSVFTHIAGALDVPCVALYGSFLASLRTAYNKKTIAIQAEGSCAPCFHHGRLRHFPEQCPSQESGVCGVLANIKIETVRDQALRQAFEWKKEA